MQRYFEYFPKILYDVAGNKIEQVLTNILLRIGIKKNLLDSSLIYQRWIIRDGDTPEIVAHKYYGSPHYHWVILMVNNIIDPYYGWCLSYDNFNAFIKATFGSIESAQTTVHHYEDLHGNTIDKTTFDSLPDNERKTIYVYDFHFNLNERKRSIKLLDKQYLPMVENEMEKIFRNVE